MIEVKFSGKEYGVEYNTDEPDIISIENRNVTPCVWYEMKVKKNDEYVYSLKKTFIKAQHGAFGLYEFLAKLAIERYADCWGEHLCDWVIEHGTLKY